MEHRSHLPLLSFNLQKPKDISIRMLLSLNRDTDLVSSIRFANLVVVGYERRPPIFLPKPRPDRSALRARGRRRARAAYAGEGPLSRPLQNCADLVSRFLSRARRRRGSGNKKRWVVRLPMVAAPGCRCFLRSGKILRDFLLGFDRVKTLLRRIRMRTF